MTILYPCVSATQLNIQNISVIQFQKIFLCFFVINPLTIPSSWFLIFIIINSFPLFLDFFIKWNHIVPFLHLVSFAEQNAFETSVNIATCISISFFLVVSILPHASTRICLSSVLLMDFELFPVSVHYEARLLKAFLCRFHFILLCFMTHFHFYWVNTWKQYEVKYMSVLT